MPTSAGLVDSSFTALAFFAEDMVLEWSVPKPVQEDILPMRCAAIQAMSGMTIHQSHTVRVQAEEPGREEQERSRSREQRDHVIPCPRFADSQETFLGLESWNVKVSWAILRVYGCSRPHTWSLNSVCGRCEAECSRMTAPEGEGRCLSSSLARSPKPRTCWNH